MVSRTRKSLQYPLTPNVESVAEDRVRLRAAYNSLYRFLNSPVSPQFPGNCLFQAIFRRRYYTGWCDILPMNRRFI